MSSTITTSCTGPERRPRGLGNWIREHLPAIRRWYGSVYRRALGLLNNTSSESVTHATEFLTPTSWKQDQGPSRGNGYDCVDRLSRLVYPEYARPEPVTMDGTVDAGSWADEIKHTGLQYDVVNWEAAPTSTPVWTPRTPSQAYIVAGGGNGDEGSEVGGLLSPPPRHPPIPTTPHTLASLSEALLRADGGGAIETFYLQSPGRSPQPSPLPHALQLGIAIEAPKPSLQCNDGYWVRNPSLYDGGKYAPEQRIGEVLGPRSPFIVPYFDGSATPRSGPASLSPWISTKSKGINYSIPRVPAPAHGYSLTTPCTPDFRNDNDIDEEEAGARTKRRGRRDGLYGFHFTPPASRCNFDILPADKLDALDMVDHEERPRQPSWPVSPLSTAPASLLLTAPISIVHLSREGRDHSPETSMDVDSDTKDVTQRPAEHGQPKLLPRYKQDMQRDASRRKPLPNNAISHAPASLEVAALKPSQNNLKSSAAAVRTLISEYHPAPLGSHPIPATLAPTAAQIDVDVGALLEEHIRAWQHSGSPSPRTAAPLHLGREPVIAAACFHTSPARPSTSHEPMAAAAAAAAVVGSRATTLPVPPVADGLVGTPCPRTKVTAAPQSRWTADMQGARAYLGASVAAVARVPRQGFRGEGGYDGGDDGDDAAWARLLEEGRVDAREDDRGLLRSVVLGAARGVRKGCRALWSGIEAVR